MGLLDTPPLKGSSQMMFELIVQHYDTSTVRDFHQHDHAHIVYLHKGCHIAYASDQSLLCMPGSLLYISPNTMHGVEILENTQTSLLSLPKLDHMPSKAMCILETSPLLTQLFSIWQNGGPSQSLNNEYKAVLLDQLITCKVATNPMLADGKIDRRLIPIIEAFSDKPNIKMSISTFATSSGASVRTLNRLFQSHFNASFKDIRNTVIMERAEQLLKSGMIATDVAFELEYSSLSAFSTAFKEYQKGKSPA